MNKLFSSLGSLVRRNINIKRVKQLFIGSIAVLALASTVVTSSTAQKLVHGAGNTTTPTPRFNFLPGDLEMLQMYNVTQKQTTWADPISANINDRVAYMVYFHNGVEDSVAHNTSVRVDFPHDSRNPVPATSWIWSDETAAISDTIVNGKTVGNSGATLNLPSAGRVDYVSGSTKLFDSKGAFVRQLPDGITNTGINIGDINGCWQYSGFITFLMDVKGEAALNIDKHVAHLSDQTWSKDITANPGEELVYQIGLRNTGNDTATSVVLKDRLPQYLTYLSGTTKLQNTANPNGKIVADTLFSADGLVVPNMAPGDPGVTYVTYHVKVAKPFPGGWWTLNNLGEVFLAGVKQGQSQATVRVFGAEPGLTVSKAIVSNNSAVEHVDANIGDIVTFKIIVTNTGNVDLTNVAVRDVLPQFSEYIPGSTFVDAVAAADFMPNGITFARIVPQGGHVIDFSVRIVGCPPLGTTDIINSGYAKADGIVEKNDTATVTIHTFLPVVPSAK
jgi:uncharacterized repeat protein (TIGR01451 family)